MKNNEKYDVSDIKVLTGIDAIRKRPEMYVGDIEDGTGWANMILEAVYFCIGDDKKEINRCNEISIVVYENNEVEVSKSGEGFPLHDFEGISFVENLMTRMHANKDLLVVVNALSSQVLISTHVDGHNWNQIYKNSKPGKIENNGKASDLISSIRFLPSEKYFHEAIINNTYLLDRLNELSFFYTCFKISFEDRRIRKTIFHNPNGLSDYLRTLFMKNRESIKSTDIIKFNEKKHDVHFEVALGFVKYNGKQASFVNGYKSIEGGTHVNGMIAGMAKAIKIVSGCKLNASLWKKYVIGCMISVINIKMPNPHYVSSTRDKLSGSKVFLITKEITSQYMISYFNDNKDFFEKLNIGFVQQYLLNKWQKKHSKYSIPSSEFAKKNINQMFVNPEQYKAIIKEYKLSEVCLNISLKMQEKNNKST